MNAYRKTLNASLTLLLSVPAVIVSNAHASGADECTKYFSQMEGSPVEVARTRAQEGDYKLLAALGYAIEVPGDIPSVTIERLGYRVLDGTSDSVSSDSCERFQKEARQFARTYNQEIVRLAQEARRI